MNNRILDKRFSIYQKFIEKAPWYQHSDFGWILMFHEVVEDLTSFEDNITISVEHFQSMIKTLRKGFSFHSLSEMWDKKDACRVFLTFDDVRNSAYINAFKWLEEEDIPYTCFVSPGLVGMKGYLNHDQLNAISNMQCCELAIHGKNHRILRGLNKKEIEDEIIEAKYALSSLVPKCSVDKYAYSYGSMYAVPRMAKMLCKNEYSFGFGTVNLPLNENYTTRNTYYLPRINVNDKNYAAVMRRMQLQCKRK